MSQPFVTQTRLGVYRLLSVQTIVVLLISAWFGVWQGAADFWAAALGGVVCLLSNWYVARKMFAYSGAQQAVKIVKSFYKAQAFKYVLVILLFIIAIRFFHVKGLPFLVSFFICQMVFWVAPLFFSNSNKIS